MHDKSKEVMGFINIDNGGKPSLKHLQPTYNAKNDIGVPSRQYDMYLKRGKSNYGGSV